MAAPSILNITGNQQLCDLYFLEEGGVFGPLWQCSVLGSNSVLRDYSWFCSDYYMWWQESKQISGKQENCLTACTFYSTLDLYFFFLWDLSLVWKWVSYQLTFDWLHVSASQSHCYHNSFCPGVIMNKIVVIPGNTRVRHLRMSLYWSNLNKIFVAWKCKLSNWHPQLALCEEELSQFFP